LPSHTSSAKTDRRAYIWRCNGVTLLVVSWPLASRDVRLTPAEASVAGLVAQGLTNRTIAKLRGVSAHTIAHQVASICKKIGLGSRRELARHLPRAR